MSTKMFKFSKQAVPPEKCTFTHGSLPAFVDENQPPSKRKPFETFSSQPFNYALDLLLPEEIYPLVAQRLHSDEYLPGYLRVYMSLGDVIEADFFNQYVKTGTAIMLSEGRPRVDNCFNLQDGILRLELDKPTYERIGLVGKSVPSGGRKHQEERFLIELNLRLPSMVHGRKGFNRIEWAFKNVLHNSLSWLFYDLNGSTQPSRPNSKLPIAKHHPFQETIRPNVSYIQHAKIPVFIPPDGLRDYEYAAELLEWLGLATLDSPRICADDSIDSYLSRYAVPTAQNTERRQMEGDMMNLVNVKWRGFMTSSLVERLFMAVRRQAGDIWFAINMCGFEGEGYSVVNSGQELLTWEWPTRNHL